VHSSCLTAVQTQQQPFYGSLSRTTRVSLYQRNEEPVSLTHPPSSSPSNLYQLLPSTTIHSILPVQFTCLTILLHNLCPSPLCLSLGVEPSTSYSIHFFSKSVSSFAAHAHTIVTCFAIVPRLYHLFLCLFVNNNNNNNNHNNNKWSKYFDIRLHFLGTRTVQSYLPGCANLHSM